VLLIEDDHPEVLEWREQRRPRADRDRGRTVAEPLPLFEAFAGAQSAVENRQFVAEAAAQPREDLVGERDFGDQHERLAARGEGLGDCSQVDLGLAAARDAVQQETLAPAFANRLEDWFQRVGLVAREGDFARGFEGGAEHVARRCALFDCDQSASGERP